MYQDKATSISCFSSVGSIKKYPNLTDIFFLRSAIFCSVLFFAVCLFSVDVVFAFKISGKVLDQEGVELSLVPLALLKQNDSGGGPPLFPVTTGKTDNLGNYIFDNITANVGDKFLLGALVEEQRLSSETIFYEGQDIIYDFIVPITTTLIESPNVLSFSINGSLQGAFTEYNFEPKVFLEAFQIDSNGQVASKVLATVDVLPDNSYLFSDLQIPQRSGLKLGINIDQVPFYSPLFFVDGDILQDGDTVQQDIVLPAAISDFNQLTLGRQTILFSASPNTIKVSHFISAENNTSFILQSSQSQYSFFVPQHAKNIVSPSIDNGQLQRQGDQFHLVGPFMPGDMILFLEYEVDTLFLKKRLEIGLLNGIQQAEILYRAGELTMGANNLFTPAQNVNIGEDNSYYSSSVDAAFLQQGGGRLTVNLLLAVAPTKFYYLLGAIFCLPLLLALILYFAKRKKITFDK